MTPEKKNRMVSILLIFAAVICIAASVFLVVRYLQVRSDADSSQSLIPSAETAVPEKTAESGIIYYA